MQELSTQSGVSGYGLLYGPSGTATQTVSKRKYGSPAIRKDTQLVLSKNSRLSQACDRCRMKKIKCDGARPSCAACNKVGFQCRHSDTLSRRGTPKNYTEALEKEVVRLQKLVAETQTKPCSKMTSLEPAQCSSKAPPAVKDSRPSPFLELPFINDTFHLYENRIVGDGQFIGHATWNVLVDSTSELATDVLPNEDDWLLRYLIQQFQLSHDLIPTVLLSKYHNDAILCGKQIRKSTAYFLETSMALVPILNSRSWPHELVKVPHSRTVHPAVLLANLLICQWKWSCFSDDALFTATKIVCLNSTQPLLRLQCLLLAAFYFMGTPGAALLTKTSTAPFASQLLKLAYGEMTNMGLFINSHRLTPVHTSSNLNHTERLITFWCFQFLDSWWTLIQGIPKTNFTGDEFLPPKISALNNPKLKPFELLLDFVFGCLDGCNLLKALSRGGSSHMVYLLETFRKQLVHFNLYHDSKDDDALNLFTSVTKLDQPLATEIQLTLFYLVVSLLAHVQSYNAALAKKVTFEAQHINAEPSIPVDESSQREKSSRVLTTQRENAYEILMLYYFVMVDSTDSKPVAPSQLKPLHFLPCDNLGVIKLCLQILASWASSKLTKSSPDYDTIFQRCQCIVDAWCNIWYFDETEDELLVRLQKIFQFNLRTPLQKKAQTFDKLLYLHSVKLQNRRILIQNQFSDAASKEHVEDPFNSLYGVDGMAMQLPTSETISALFNPLAMQEEDEGYAEDDDEDDEPFLEISLGRRKQLYPKQDTVSHPQFEHSRSSSLFDNRQSAPISKRFSIDVKDQQAGSNGVREKDGFLKNRMGLNEKWPSDHYLLVQDLQKPSPAVGTPRSLADLLCPSTDVVAPAQTNESSKVPIN
ncbi:LAFA_0A02960g1_1 [Lachancea sp. 'fantastica']|nr:LAFA_0A02960g1_1 [Lachancea sp. 'fantastica']